VQLEAINLGRRETISLGRRRVDTGIDKRPVEQALVGPLGVEGDVVANAKHHGGPDQAVYLYARADYDWWVAELGRPLAPGTFGENLTIPELDVLERRPGDRFRIGAVLLELTSARIPCSVFAHRMGDRHWVKRFRDAERPGSYARVLEPGMLAVGDPIELIQRDDGPTLLDSFRLYYDRAAPAPTIERVLTAPVRSTSSPERRKGQTKGRPEAALRAWTGASAQPSPTPRPWEIPKMVSGVV